MAQDWPRSRDTDLIVVRGAYGRGKTSFLDTLAAAKEAVADYGSPDRRWDSLVGEVGAAKVMLDWEASDDERNRAAISESLLSSESIFGRPASSQCPASLRPLLAEPGSNDRGSVHYFHDTRALEPPLSYGADDATIRNRLTSRNSKFSDLYDLLDQPGFAAARQLATQRLSELFPALELVGLTRQGTGFHPTLRDKRTGATRFHETLTTSERQAFLFALYTSKHRIVDSIILLDAPEIGFGSEGAVDVVRALLRWTERTQLIVATSSNAVASIPEVAHVVELPQ